MTLRTHPFDSRYTAALPKSKATVPVCPLFAGEQELKPFEPVLKQNDSLRKYEIDLAAAYRHLSPRAQAYIDKISQYRVTPAEIAAFQDQKRLGYIEEAGDTLYEYCTLQAIRQDLIDQKAIPALAKRVRTAQQEQKPFMDLVREVREELPASSVEKFQSFTGVSDAWTRTILTLTLLKFALYQNRGCGGDVEQITRKRLMSEARELVEHQPQSVSKTKFLSLMWLYSRFPALPPDALQRALQEHVRQALRLPVQPVDLMRNAFLKQLGRNELDYDHPTWSKSDRQRKNVLKPFEALIEASILKNVQNRTQEPG